MVCAWGLACCILATLGGHSTALVQRYDKQRQALKSNSLHSEMEDVPSLPLSLVALRQRSRNSIAQPCQGVSGALPCILLCNTPFGVQPCNEITTWTNVSFTKDTELLNKLRENQAWLDTLKKWGLKPKSDTMGQVEPAVWIPKSPWAVTTTKM